MTRLPRTKRLCEQCEHGYFHIWETINTTGISYNYNTKGAYDMYSRFYKEQSKKYKCVGQQGMLVYPKDMKKCDKFEFSYLEPFDYMESFVVGNYVSLVILNDNK